MIEYRSIAWWYWLLTVCLLTVGVSAVPVGFKAEVRYRSMDAVTLARFAALIKAIAPDKR
jgi:hypothetical protein